MKNYVNFFQYASVFQSLSSSDVIRRQDVRPHNSFEFAYIAVRMLIMGESVTSSVFQRHCPGKGWSYYFKGLGGRLSKIVYQ